MSAGVLIETLELAVCGIMFFQGYGEENIMRCTRNNWIGLRKTQRFVLIVHGKDFIEKEKI